MKSIFFKILILACSITLTHQFIFSNQQPVVLVIGTRPEAIKMIPVHKALQEIGIPAVICSTGQHTDLLDDIFTIFNVMPDRALNIMKPGQDLFHITTTVLTKMKDYLTEVNPSLVLVQGDTTSAMAAALAAFYLKIPVGHVEAGLRTGNIYAPYPEEMNRQFISLIASYHFTPTASATDNLINEHHPSKSIFCVGNTVVDALLLIREQIEQEQVTVCPSLKQIITQCKADNKKIMLLTAHRRESFDGGLKHIFSAIKKSLELHPNLFIIYPMHPNPIIKETFAESNLGSMANILVSKPLSYCDLAYLLNAADFIATDSGGIQEEGVSLGKPVLILRNETDRPEGVTAGIAQLVGTDEECIIENINTILAGNFVIRRNSNTIYGDGTAALQIAQIIKNTMGYAIPERQS